MQHVSNAFMGMSAPQIENKYDKFFAYNDEYKDKEESDAVKIYENTLS